MQPKRLIKSRNGMISPATWNPPDPAGVGIRHQELFFINFAGKRINFNIIKTGRTKDTCIDMPTAISPKIKFAAIPAKINTAPVTKDNGLFLFAYLA
jgi:hypothetical protein